MLLPNKEECSLEMKSSVFCTIRLQKVSIVRTAFVFSQLNSTPLMSRNWWGGGQVSWCTPFWEAQAGSLLRQPGLYTEFQASQGYLVNPLSKQNRDKARAQDEAWR